MTKDIIGLLDPLAQQVFALLNERQRRAYETDDPYAVGSTIGSVRSGNEDVALIVRLRFGSAADRDLDLAIVCDGMGGMQEGRFAAQLAASVFVHQFIRFSRTLPFQYRMQGAVSASQRAVYDALRGDGGTTLSAICLDRSGRGQIAHVGDSRIYSIAVDGGLTQLTRDDTIGAALNREGPDHADFNRLIQYVGMSLDAGEPLEPFLVEIQPSPSILGYVLTSDGAHGAPKEALSRLGQYARSGTEVVRKLLNLADALGGLDNATAAFLPSQPAITSQVRLANGTSISLLAPAGGLQVWSLPIPQPDERHELVTPREPSREVASPRPSEPAKATQEEPTPQYDQDGNRDVAKAKPKRRRSTSSGRKTKPKGRSDPGLPLDQGAPEVRVHFPDDDQS